MNTDLSFVTLPPELLNAILSQERDAMKRLYEHVFNEIMLMEREQYLGVAPYERGPHRVDSANGFKDKNFSTRLGTAQLKVPQVRSSKFYPSCLEKGLRSEQALMSTIAEMYLQGVSTRKVTKVLEQMCGEDISSAQVSNLTKKLDEEFEKFRCRPLGSVDVLYLDARYEKCRVDGRVLDIAVLVASGVNTEGRREILGVSVELSEAEVHWRNFLKNLVSRGLGGVKLIVSDDHNGLGAARKTIFPGVQWQRCLFHYCQNAQAYVPRAEMRESVAQDIRDIFNCASKEEAIGKAARVVKKYEKVASHLSRWLEETAHEVMSFYNFDRRMWKKIRSINYVERLNRELKRRTRVVGVFPNPDSLLRLTTAILIEAHEEWVTGKAFWTAGKITNPQDIGGANSKGNMKETLMSEMTI